MVFGSPLFYKCIFISEKDWIEWSMMAILGLPINLLLFKWKGKTTLHVISQVLLGSTCIFCSCNYVWREKVRRNLMELWHLSKLQYVYERALASTSMMSSKLTNKLLMDILTIYYRYLTWRFTWILKTRNKIFSSLVNLIWPFNDLQYMRL